MTNADKADRKRKKKIDIAVRSVIKKAQKAGSDSALDLSAYYSEMKILAATVVEAINESKLCTVGFREILAWVCYIAPPQPNPAFNYLLGKTDLERKNTSLIKALENDVLKALLAIPEQYDA